MTGLESLVEKFAQNTAAQTDCILRGDARAGNKHAEKALAAFMALRERGDAGRDALAALFSHARMDVRVTAAAFLLRHKTAEGTSLVRRKDWDSLSDWGQLVRGLKLGSSDAPVGVWFGALESYSLLSAHLVQRYSNRSNPDYHPAGGFLTGTLGPLYTQAFASDVLGARLMGAEVALDLEHVLFGQPREPGRYTLALSAVHDWGNAGGRAPSVTLAHLDGTAVVLVRPGFEAHLLAGWGG
ncbi:DUF2019 domain-containing protein, partial [Corallococcus sp. AS-1-12]|nr:DUF2019 domain-containing protein [Corallococcus sp. AS-1-12]